MVVWWWVSHGMRLFRGAAIAIAIGLPADAYSIHQRPTQSTAILAYARIFLGCVNSILSNYGCCLPRFRTAIYRWR
jgi:hypothetical protein